MPLVRQYSCPERVMAYHNLFDDDRQILASELLKIIRADNMWCAYCHQRMRVDFAGKGSYTEWFKILETP